MSKVYRFDDHIIVLADYRDPEPHSHLSAHLIISLDGDMMWKINNETIISKAICIKGSVTHAAITPKGEKLVFFFMATSSYFKSLNNMFSDGKEYVVFDDDTVKNMILIYCKYKNSPKELDDRLLNLCNIFRCHQEKYDNRIEVALMKIE